MEKQNQKQILLLTGPTGCGKTYRSFQYAGRKRVLYAAPCRQLVYETYTKYGTKNSQILTGDFKFVKKNPDKTFVTYECMSQKLIEEVDVVIIDEAHFLEDKERGGMLAKNILFAKSIGKKILLLSATMQNCPKEVKIINLPQRGDFYKEEISSEEFWDRAKQGVKTLFFCNSKKEAMAIVARLDFAEAITADTPLVDRIKIIRRYESGEISFIAATNCLAQGVNISAENLFISMNRFDTQATLLQKIGRIGRCGVTNSEARLTICYQADIEAFDIAPIKTSKEGKLENIAKKPSFEKEERIKPSPKEIKEMISLIIKR